MWWLQRGYSTVVRTKSKSIYNWCKNCVVESQEGKGAGSGFVREQEAAETCHYPQRGGGDEAALKYGGCISTTNRTDNRVALHRKVDFYSRRGSARQQTGRRVPASSLYPSLHQCKEVLVKGLRCLETVTEGRLEAKPDSFQQQPSPNPLLQRAESGCSRCIIPLRCNMRGLLSQQPSDCKIIYAQMASGWGNLEGAEAESYRCLYCGSLWAVRRSVYMFSYSFLIIIHYASLASSISDQLGNVFSSSVPGSPCQPYLVHLLGLIVTRCSLLMQRSSGR